jgi:DNA-binding protein Fis
MDSDSKTKLWQYIAENLKDLHECPYCGEKFDIAPSVCGVCGWKLTFDSPEYFEYYEKTHLLKKLYSMADSLGKDQIKKLASLVDTALNNNSIKPVDLEFNYEFLRQESSLKELKEHMEKQKVKEILAVHGNNISKAAKILGISRPTLYNFKKKYDL